MDIRSPLGLAPAALPGSLQAAAAGRPPASGSAGDVALRRSSIVSPYYSTVLLTVSMHHSEGLQRNCYEQTPPHPQ